MSLFSFLGRKKQQESATEAPDFTSRSAEESQAYRSNNRSNSRSSTRSTKESDGAAEAALPEKKRARRRLVGAIALVLAAIIGLPMLFDTEQKSVPDDIAIQLPSMDTPAAATAPALPAPPAGASSSGAVPAATGLSQQEEIIDPAPAAIAPAPIADNAVAETKPVPKPEPKPELKHEPEPKHEPKPEPKHEPKQTAKADEAERARAILEGRAETAAPEKKSSKFALQVAALATQDKVDELQGKLRDAGIKSYTQKVTTQSGARIRVRVGPFAGKEEAEKVRAKLVQLGYGGTLVPVN